jgi:hypothetical protein
MSDRHYGLIDYQRQTLVYLMSDRHYGLIGCQWGICYSMLYKVIKISYFNYYYLWYYYKAPAGIRHRALSD